jgi:hypothetical protein
MRHLFHKWGKWSAPWCGHGGYSYQQRRCLICNRANMKKVHYVANTPALLHEIDAKIVTEELNAS